MKVKTLKEQLQGNHTSQLIKLDFQKVIQQQAKVIQKLQKEIQLYKQALYSLVNQQHFTNNAKQPKQSCSQCLTFQQEMKSILQLQKEDNSIWKVIKDSVKRLKDQKKDCTPIFVERVKQKKIPVYIQKIKQIEKIVEKIVQVVKVEEKIVYVEKIVEVPILREKIVQKYSNKPTIKQNS